MLCTVRRSADPRRVAEARVHRLRTHRVAVYARPKEGTVAELAYVPRERIRLAGVRLDGDVIGRGGRSRCRRRPCLPFRPPDPSPDRPAVALPGCGRPPIGVPRFTALLLAGILPRISRTTPQPTSHCKDHEVCAVEVEPNACGSGCLLFPRPNSIAIGTACAITSSTSHHAEVSSPCRSRTSVGDSPGDRNIGDAQLHHEYRLARDAA
jgi:hypothetical protein